jgi:small subunit ribosomal protein S20
MPRTKSAKKQMRQAKTRTARNRAQRSALRTAVKKVRSVSGDAKQSAAAYLEATKLLDRSGRKGLIHKNTAARQKSRLAKAIKR